MDTKISEFMFGKEKIEKIGEIIPAKISVKLEGNPKRLVIRTMIVTKSRILYTSTKEPFSNKSVVHFQH